MRNNVDYFPLMDWALVQDPRDSLVLIIAQHLGQRAGIVAACLIYEHVGIRVTLFAFP
jgi:hypothetical protein